MANTTPTREQLVRESHKAKFDGLYEALQRGIDDRRGGKAPDSRGLTSSEKHWYNRGYGTEDRALRTGVDHHQAVLGDLRAVDVGALEIALYEAK
jgi:hypothetical protein